MKCIVLLVIYCGLASAYDAATECDVATKELTKTLKLSKINAAASVLWQMRRSIDSQREELNKYPDSKNNEIQQAEFRIIQMANTCMRIFDDFVREAEATGVVWTVSEKVFIAMTSARSRIESANSGLINAISSAHRKEPQATASITQSSTIMRSFFINTSQIFISSYTHEKNFSEKIIELVGKLNSNLDAVVETLALSPFGNSIVPLVNKYRHILRSIGSFIWRRYLDASSARKRTTLLFVINKFYDMFGIENFWNVIWFVCSVLKESTADDIIKLVPPEESIKQTCKSMETIVDSKLTSILYFIDVELRDEKDSYFEFLKQFYIKIFPMEAISIILETQWIRILKATGIAKNNADALNESNSEKIDIAYVECILEQSDPVYNIRHYYKAAGEQIDQRILSKAGNALTIIRRMWNDLVSRLFIILTNERVHPKTVGFLSVIEQKLHIWTTSVYLTKAHATKDLVLMVNFEEIKQFEDGISTFVDVLSSLEPVKIDEKDDRIVAEYVDEMLNKNFDEERKTAESAAQIVYTQTQYVLYKLNAVFKSSIIAEVDEAIRKIGGQLSIKKSESRVTFREPFALFVETFQQLAPYFQRLVELHKKFSADIGKNGLKLAMIDWATGELNVAFDFVLVANILEYFAKFVGQSTGNVGDINAVDQKAIEEACASIKSNFGMLNAVIQQLEKMDSADNRTPMDIVDIKEISKLVWKQHCIGLRDRILQIQRTLSLPLAGQTQLREAYNKIRVLCWFDQIDDDDFEETSEIQQIMNEEIKVEQGAGKMAKREREVDDKEEEEEDGDIMRKRSKSQQFSATEQWIHSVNESGQLLDPSESETKQTPHEME